MKTSSGFLSVFLILSLILSLSACTTQTGSDTGEQQSVQVFYRAISESYREDQQIPDLPSHRRSGC